MLFDKKEGSFATKFQVISLLLHGFEYNDLQYLTINGKIETVKENHIRFFTSNFNFADYGPFDMKSVLTTSFPNSNDEIKIHW